MTVEERDAQITETNQRILNCCTELIRKLAADPEVHIMDVVLYMRDTCIGRSAQIREKHRELRDMCDRFDRREKDALA